MTHFTIRGGKPLNGDVTPSGSKNAALPILAATLLTDKIINLENLPDISDIASMIACLGVTGKQVQKNSHGQLTLGPANHSTDSLEVSSLYAGKLRGSILLLGPLLARYKKVTLPLPGGCRIGNRPIDQHLKAMRALGVTIEEFDDRIECLRSTNRLIANTIHFDLKTVTGTENAIMATVLAEGTSVLTNVAEEPEIVDLVNFLNSMGARITWKNSDTLEIIGIESLSECTSYSVMNDRIEAGTWLVAAAISHGSICVKGINPDWLKPCIETLQAAGASVTCDESSISLTMTAGNQKPINIVTGPYPEFPTDLQSIFLTLATVLDGESIIHETMFENRFMIVDELAKMGAKISVDMQTAIITGNTQLRGTTVHATDLRSGAALVLAALATSDDTQTRIYNIEHILRGYERFDEKLIRLGANIQVHDELQESISAEVLFNQRNKNQFANSLTFFEGKHGAELNPVVSKETDCNSTESISLV